MVKKPTLRQEAEVLRLIRDAANLMSITGKSDHFNQIVLALDNWSYAHRVGNGEFTAREQQQIINKAFWKLDTIVRKY